MDIATRHNRAAIRARVGLTAGHTDVSLWYAVHASRDATLAFDAREFHGVRWFGFDALPLDRTDPHLQRFVGKLRRQRNARPGSRR